MTEQQAAETLAAHLPPDALVEVRRNSWIWHGVEKVWWLVGIRHVPTGYLKAHDSRGDTAEAAIDHALAKWYAHVRRFEREGVPRWVQDPDNQAEDVRVRLAVGRLFFRDDGLAREVAYLAGGGEVLISAAVPLHARGLVLAAAMGGGEARMPQNAS